MEVPEKEAVPPLGVVEITSTPYKLSEHSLECRNFKIKEMSAYRSNDINTGAIVTEVWLCVCGITGSCSEANIRNTHELCRMWGCQLYTYANSALAGDTLQASPYSFPAATAICTP